jgi:hypothetical protein
MIIKVTFEELENNFDMYIDKLKENHTIFVEFESRKYVLVPYDDYIHNENMINNLKGNFYGKDNN